jgi:hypothetical protein
MAERTKGIVSAKNRLYRDQDSRFNEDIQKKRHDEITDRVNDIRRI